MAMQYKPTKQKKEKPAKAPKVPKADKPMKMGGAVKVKVSKPVKAPKAPKIKAPKPEKAVAFKLGKVENAANLQKTSMLKEPVNMKIVLPILLGLVVLAVLAITVVLPAIERHGQEIDHIIVSTVPTKTVYLIGEEVNYDGLRVSVVQNNGDSFIVRANKCKLSGFDSSKEGYCRIVVEYEGFTADFSIAVEEPPRPTPALKGITLITLPKTEYKLGEGLDTTGGVILCEYVDGSVYRVNLTNRSVYGYGNFSGPGEYVLTVKYMENGTLAETTYTITVTE